MHSTDQVAMSLNKLLNSYKANRQRNSSMEALGLFAIIDTMWHLLLCGGCKAKKKQQ